MNVDRQRYENQRPILIYFQTLFVKTNSMLISRPKSKYVLFKKRNQLGFTTCYDLIQPMSEKQYRFKYLNDIYNRSCIVRNY